MMYSLRLVVVCCFGSNRINQDSQTENIKQPTTHSFNYFQCTWFVHLQPEKGMSLQSAYKCYGCGEDINDEHKRLQAVERQETHTRITKQSINRSQLLQAYNYVLLFLNGGFERAVKFVLQQSEEAGYLDGCQHHHINRSANMLTRCSPIQLSQWIPLPSLPLVPTRTLI